MFASGRRTCMRKNFKNWSMRVEWFEHLSLEKHSVYIWLQKKLLTKRYYILSVWMLIYRMFCKIINIFNFFFIFNVNLRPMWDIKIVIIGWVVFFFLFVFYFFCFFYIMVKIFNIFNYYSVHLFACMAPIEFSQSYPTAVTIWTVKSTKSTLCMFLN